MCYTDQTFYYYYYYYYCYLVMEAFDDAPFKTIHRRKDVALLLCKMIKLYTSATYGSPASLKITLNLGDLRAELQAT